MCCDVRKYIVKCEVGSVKCGVESVKCVKWEVKCEA